MRSGSSIRRSQPRPRADDIHGMDVRVLSLGAAFLFAAAVTQAAPSKDELIVAEWISTGAQAERMVLPRLQAAIESLKVDPSGQTATSAVRLLGQRLVTTQKKMRVIRDSVLTFEKGLVTEPAREFCEQMVTALDRASGALDSAQLVVTDLKRDSTLIATRGQDLTRPFQSLRSIRWNTEAQRAKVLAAAERIRAARR
jgi:hypothetical protein